MPENLTIPEHIAIIMDGNGRWASRRGLLRVAGHAAGAKAFRNIIDYCIEIGVKCLTIFAFSTENWKRPAAEVTAIIKLLDEYLDECIRDLELYDSRVRFIGDRSVFDGYLTDKMEYIEKKSAGKTLNLNIAVNYGGRSEIIRAVNRCIEKNPGKPVTSEEFESGLYTVGLPDPDLIIRTAGEKRLSNFLLWQCAYAELWYTDSLWPDFSNNTLNEAIIEYSGRKRRYGGI